MARHAKRDKQRWHSPRLWSLTVIWVVGLVAALLASLAAVARYGCMTANPGLACRRSGSVLGVILLVAVIALLTSVTLLTYGRPRRHILIISGVGLAAVIGFLVCAVFLLATA